MWVGGWVCGCVGVCVGVRICGSKTKHINTKRQMCVCVCVYHRPQQQSTTHTKQTPSFTPHTRHTLITNLGHVGPQLLPVHVPREVAHVHPLRLLGRVQRPAAAPLAPAAGRLPVVAAARLAVLLWWPRVVVWRGGGGVVVSRSTDRVWWWCGGLFPPLPTEKKMPFSLPFSPRRSPALFPPLFPPLPFSLALLASLASPPV